jgi:2-polyprenylphenol 6-hydroxylase
MKYDFDILIVGGGMVGACVAALAATHPRCSHLRIALLEARPPAMPPDEGVDVRVSAFSRASERVLSAVGAWQGIPSRSLSAYHDMFVWDAAGKPRGAGSIHFSASRTSEPNLGHIVENRRVQWALYGCEAFRRRVTVLRAELAGLALEPERAAVSLADGRKVTASLVIGADGADSLSRRLAGIETVGWSYDQCAFVTHVSTELPHQSAAWQRFLPDGPIAFLPLGDGRSSIVWSTRPDHARHLVECPPELAAREIQAAIGEVFGTVIVAAPRAQFPLRLRHARSYCAQRFVLVGDAAHAMHPLAGQGVNLGFLDCAALIEVLAQAVDADGELVAEPRVLRRYERWRKSENTLALGVVDGLSRLFRVSNPLAGWARRTGLSAIDQSTLAKGFLMGRALGTRGEIPRLASLPRAPS